MKCASKVIDKVEEELWGSQHHVTTETSNKCVDHYLGKQRRESHLKCLLVELKIHRAGEKSFRILIDTDQLAVVESRLPQLVQLLL